MPFKLSQALRDALARSQPAEATQAAPAPASMRIVAAGDDRVTLLIFGNIGATWWDDESVTAKSVIEQLQDFAGAAIDVRINSYGGSVSDGIAIHNELRRHAKAGRQINVTVEGAACSIASLIAAAGDTVTMPSNTLMMLHAPWGALWIEGNAKLVREVSEEFASVLETMGKAMAASYARKSGRPADEFVAMWDTGKDYWYTAEEAKAMGLCDVIEDASEPTAPDEDAEASTALLASLVASAPAGLRASVRAAFNPNPQRRAQPGVPAHDLPASAGAPEAAQSVAHHHQEASMPNRTNPADNPNPANTQPSAEQAAAITSTLQARNAQLREMVRAHAGNADIVAYVDGVIDAADPTVTVENVGMQILALHAKNAQAIAGTAATPAGGGEDRGLRRTAMAAAIQARLGHGDARAMDGNPYGGMSLPEMARACAEQAGVRTGGMQPEQYIMAAITHTSSDFPALIGGAVERAVLRGFESAPDSIELFTRDVQVADFNKQSLAGLGQFIGIKEVREGAEYPYGTFADQGMELKLAKRGGIFSITWEAILSERLGLLDAVPAKMGAAARRSLADDVYGILTGNPTLADGVAAFATARGNLVSTGTALSTASLSAAFAQMAVQKDADGNLLHIPAKIVVVPVGQGALARQILDSQYELTAGRNATVPNVMRGRFVVVEDPRLDVADPNAWYVIADPAVGDGIVIAYLNGQKTPQISQKEGWNVDGIEIKVRLAAQAAVANPLALLKNPGA